MNDVMQDNEHMALN